MGLDIFDLGMIEPQQKLSSRRFARLIAANVARAIGQRWLSCERFLRAELSGPSKLVLLVCAFFAVRALLLHGLTPLGAYDEGLLFTDAFLMDHGRAIYRDFYVNYPPGILQIVRALHLLGLPAIWGARMLAMLVRLAGALLTGWLAGRAQRRPMNWSAAVIVLVLQAQIGVALYAYSVAVTLVLSGIASWSRTSASRMHRIAGGVLLGLLSYLRHDLFVYGVTLWCGLEITSYAVRRRLLVFDSLAELGWFATATAVTTLTLWLPPLATAGFSRVLHDIVIDQAQLTMPGRLLPLPTWSGKTPVPVLNLTVPVWASDQLHVCLIIAAGATLSALLMPLRIVASGTHARSTRITLLLAIFSLATLPQALQRTDYHHAAFCVPLTVAALFALVGDHIAMPLLCLSLLPWFVSPPGFIGLEQVKQLLSQRDDVSYFTPERRQLVTFVSRELAPNQPLFVGCTSHRRVLMSSLDVYYVVRRPGATRYMQFDPGTVTGEKGQREMIADLERARPKLALRQPFCSWYEPNLSQVDGSTLLDEYLARTYIPDGFVGGFQVWRRSAGK